MGSRGRAALALAASLVVLAAMSATALALRPATAPAVAPGTDAATRALRGLATHAARAVDNLDHLYVLDGWGGVHPVGASPALAATASWPDRDIAFGLALFPDGTGGYVMDGYGKLHALGMAPAVDSGVYWPGWVGAREVVMAPWSSAAYPAGYLLDADGGIHPFGGAPAVNGNALWPSTGIARGLVLTTNSTPLHVMGYTLDGYGGVHPFGGAPAVTGVTVRPGVDEFRGVVLVPAAGGGGVEGYTLDFSGGIHPFGAAPTVTPSARWPGDDMADAIVEWTAAPAGRPGGWVLDRQGSVHAYGSAPAVSPSATWPGWDIARGLAGAGSGGGSTERLILEPEPRRDSWGSYYNQRDTRWATNAVGFGSFPVWRIGCLLSDLAMVYSHFGFGSVTPGTVAAHPGWFDGRGAMLNSALDVPGHLTSVARNPSAHWISAQLAAGHPVIVGMNLPEGGTHFVTLTGMDGAGDWWTNDPWEQNAMHVTFSGQWWDRGPIYEAIAFA